jgi:hypothetical protein
MSRCILIYLSCILYVDTIEKLKEKKKKKKKTGGGGGSYREALRQTLTRVFVAIMSEDKLY